MLSSALRGARASRAIEQTWVFGALGAAVAQAVVVGAVAFGVKPILTALTGGSCRAIEKR